MTCRTGVLSGLALCAGIAGSPGAARAHHPVAEQSPGHEQPVSRAAVEVSAGGFTLPYGSGNLFSATLASDLAVGSRFALGLRLPFVLVQLRDNGTRAGVGDVDLAGKLRVLGNPSRSLSLGASVELPSRDADQGLGSGHLELAPFLTGGWSADRWLIHGTLGDSISLGGDDHEHEHAEAPHGSFVSPHSNHELYYHLGVQVQLVPAFFANLTLGGATVLVPAELGETTLVVGPELGFLPGGAWRITAGVQVPFVGPRRFDWKATVATELRF